MYGSPGREISRLRIFLELSSSMGFELTENYDSIGKQLTNWLENSLRDLIF